MSSRSASSRAAASIRDISTSRRNVLDKTLQERTPAIEDQLFSQAIAAVEGLELDTHQIGTVLSSTLYSLGGPTLAHRLVEHFRMRPDTDKYHVVGVGCASAVPLMRLLGQCLHGHPGQPGVIVAAESMSGILSSTGAEDPRAKVVGSAIFGDGCAAALLSDDPGADGPAITASRVCQIPGTLDAVSLELAGADIYLRLSRDLPDLAAAGLDELVGRFLHEHGVNRREVDHWMVHPGGRRIIDCVQEALSLSDEDVGVSRDVLARRGNIGTPAIFYVLHETIEQRGPCAGDRGLVVTIGPGISVGLMLLQWSGGAGSRRLFAGMKRYGLIVLLVALLAWIAVAIARNSTSLGLLGAGALLGPARISPACLPATIEHTARLPVTGTGASVEVSPEPETDTANPRTQISFLGVAPADIRAVSVVGHRSGAHSGRLQAYSQGDGASFLPDSPFDAGEQVLVRAVIGAGAGGRQVAFHFRVNDPYPTEGAAEFPNPAASPADYQSFATMPGVQAPILDVTSGDRDPAAGDILTTNGPGPGSTGH